MFWVKLLFAIIMTALFVLKLIYEHDKKEVGVVTLLYIMFVVIVSSGSFF